MQAAFDERQGDRVPVKVSVIELPRQKIEAAGNLPTGGSAAAFARQIQAKSQANARIIKKAGITAGS